MSAGHGIHIEEFAARGRLPLKAASVPGCLSELMPVVVAWELELEFVGLVAGNRVVRNRG